MDLKEYLLSNFHDDKYKEKNLIYIFIHDRKYYKQLLGKAVIKSEGNNFLTKYRGQLEEAEQINIEGFRKLKYEALIDDFLAKASATTLDTYTSNADTDKKMEANKIVYADEHKDVYINLLCSHDKTKMSVSIVAKYRRNGNLNTIPFPIYECKSCGRLYTSLAMYPNRHQITDRGKIYTNLTPQKNSADYKKPPVIKVRKISKASFYIIEKKAKSCVNKACANHSLKQVFVVFNGKMGTKLIHPVRQCSSCNAYYLPFSRLRMYDFTYDVINKDELPEIEAKIQKRKEEKAKKKRLKKEKKKAALEAQRIKQKEEIERKNQQRKLEEAKYAQLIEQKRQYEISVEKETKNKSKTDITTIDVKDFVIRRSVFKCMHNEHKLKDIVATLSLIDKKGHDRETKINAGYCENCNVYFILESTYVKLKRLGIPLCRVSDEKNYLKSVNVNGMHLASESILMQYGYNVSQDEDLSEVTRHKILATLIDKHIMSKSEVISYLDFFISQKQSRSLYQMAIGKWELDRNFVENYRIRKYQEIGVLGIGR